jgi:hypothetical protein
MPTSAGVTITSGILEGGAYFDGVSMDVGEDEGEDKDEDEECEGEGEEDDKNNGASHNPRDSLMIAGGGRAMRISSRA